LDLGPVSLDLVSRDNPVASDFLGAQPSAVHLRPKRRVTHPEIGSRGCKPEQFGHVVHTR
jgi:hypothetical protein